MIAIPLYLLAGAALPASTFLLCLLINLFLWARKRHSTLLLHLLFILLMGDSRDYSLYYFKDLRIACILLVSMITLFDLLNRKYSFNRKFLTILPFIFSASISLIYSPWPLTAFQRTLSYFLVVFIAFNYVHGHYRLSKGLLLQEMVYFTMWVFLLGLLNNIINPSGSLVANRFRGIMGNPNGVGLYAIVAMPLYIWARHILKNINRDTFIWAVGFLSLALFLSNSRNGLASVFLFLGAYFVMTRSWIFKAAFFGLVVPIMILLLTNFTIGEIFTSIGLGEYMRVDSLSDASGRVLSWTYAFQEIPKKILFGGGFYYEQYIYDVMLPPALKIYREMSSSWSSYITFVLNTGVVGISLFFLFLLLNFRSVKHRPFAIAFFIAVIFSGVFESWLTASLNSFTIYMFAMMAISQIDPATISSTKPHDAHSG